MRKTLWVTYLTLIFSLSVLPAYAGAVAQTLGPGGAGFAIVSLLVMAAFGALAYMITSALGMGQIAGMIKLVTVFSCISLVVGSIWKAISAVAKAFGIGL